MNMLTVEFAKDKEHGAIGFQTGTCKEETQANVMLVLCETEENCIVGHNDHDIKRNNPFLALQFYCVESIDVLTEALQNAKIALEHMEKEREP